MYGARDQRSRLDRELISAEGCPSLRRSVRGDLALTFHPAVIRASTVSALIPFFGSLDAGVFVLSS